MNSFKKSLLIRLSLLFVCVCLPLLSNAADDTSIDPIVGRWNIDFGKKHPDKILVINPDGSFKISGPKFREKGKWMCLSEKTIPPTYQLNYSDGRVIEQYHLSGDVLKRKNGKGAYIAVGNRIR
jgi:hypothetical protein